MVNNTVDMSQTLRVAVIIVSYNTRDLLLECVASVLAVTGGVEFELVVIDNGSEDGSYEELRKRYPAVTAVSNKENLGFGAACNQGIKATTAPFVLLLNSDARITPEALAALHECMRGNQRCGAAGCKLVTPHGARLNNTRNFLTPFNQAVEMLGVRLPSRGLSRTYRPEVGGGHIDCKVDWIEGSCLMIRREALDEVGLLDEQFFMYSEDEDLCLRLRNRGWVICYTEAGTSVHHGGASSQRNKEQMLFHFYRSQMLFLRKHRGHSSISQYMAAMRSVLRLKCLSSRLLARADVNRDLSERLGALKRARASLN
jgi:GT2 family glycosyltransferase